MHRLKPCSGLTRWRARRDKRATGNWPSTVRARCSRMIQRTPDRTTPWHWLRNIAETPPRRNASLLKREDSGVTRDRKSTRLNSSHGYISYAVFCLKKKKNTTTDRLRKQQ